MSQIMIIIMFIHDNYNICSTWFLDIRIYQLVLLFSNAIVFEKMACVYLSICIITYIVVQELS